jgi:S-DNA-T family DNA segregation ATPase FtsK/SpoIIIE
MWLLGRVPVRRKVQILGLCLLSVAVFLALALATRDGRDTTTDLLSTGSVRNQGGVIGAISAAALCTALGTLGAWLIPLALAAWGWNRIRLRPAGELWLRTAVFACGTTAALGLLFLLTGGNRVLVGSSGEWIGAAASRLLGRVGSELVLGTALVVIAVVAFELNASSPLRKAAAALFARILPAPSPKRRAAEAPEAAPAAEPVRRGRKAPIDEEEEALASALSEPEEPRRESKPRIVARREAERAEAMTIPFPPPAPVSAPKDEKRRSGAGGLPAFAAGAASAATVAAADAALGIGPAVAADVALPSIDLLDRHESKHTTIEESELFELSRVLERTLADFDVAGKVSEVHPGPVITLFEYEPAPGVKVNQIMNRQDDLALSLKAQRIRIVAPIPGKAAVGIEIPNRKKTLVSFREIVVSKQFKETSDPLPFALGKDVAGEPFTASLEKMPHLLIAGATGSGKSVCINTLIMSLLMKRKPSELQFIMIDPKMLELTPYNGIPHLRMPVVTDPKKAAQSLRFCVKQMEERYQLLAKHGARNIESYNRLDLQPTQHGETARLPYLVVVVDELADLMALLPTEIEEPIGRLAQMARAVGIHLILATQRPSVDVITGMIKANFPSRIAFQVASRVDSRVILDMNGAESLLGHGDSLFLPAGKPEPYRIHGSYVSAEEIERVVSFLKSQGAPVAADDSALEQVRALEETESDDALFDEAMRLVVLHQQASTSMLQRRLKVGYSRAARLLDLLEERGVVGPSEGAKGREVLVTEHELSERRSAAMGEEES